MIGKAIFGFIDILGYRSVVEEHINNEQLIKDIEGITRESSVKLIRGIRNIPTKILQHRKHLNEIMDAIKVRYISDSVLLTLQLPDMSASQNISDDSISDYIYMYFLCISMFCPRFMSKTGLLLRGGIAIGPHYESEFDGSLFVFSKAYLDAYDLQVEGTARVVISEKLILFLEKLPFQHLNEFVYKDDDGSMCFDFYCFLRHDKNSEALLSHIRNGVLFNIRKNRKDKEVLKKLGYFVQYHNRKMLELGFNNLSIQAGVAKEK